MLGSHLPKYHNRGVVDPLFLRSHTCKSAEGARAVSKVSLFWKRVKKSCLNKSDCSLTKGVVHAAEQRQLVIFTGADPKMSLPSKGRIGVVIPELWRKRRQRPATASSSCASLVSPLVTESVHPGHSVSTDRTFQLCCNRLSPVQQKGFLIYCLHSVVHSAGQRSIIFAWGLKSFNPKSLFMLSLNLI